MMVKENPFTQLRKEDFYYFDSEIESQEIMFTHALQARKDFRNFYAMLVSRYLERSGDYSEQKVLEIIRKIDKEYVQLMAVCDAIQEEERSERRARREEATTDSAWETHCETAYRHEPDAGLAM